MCEREETSCKAGTFAWLGDKEVPLPEVIPLAVRE